MRLREELTKAALTGLLSNPAVISDYSEIVDLDYVLYRQISNAAQAIVTESMIAMNREMAECGEI